VRWDLAPRQLVSPRRLRWLQAQIAQWRSEGLVDEANAAAIQARYEASSRARGARPGTEKSAVRPFLRCHAVGEVRCGIESFFACQKDAKRLERSLGRKGARWRA